MIRIVNSIFPLKEYKALTIWPFVFVRKDNSYTETDDRHEHIHGEQQKEMLVVGLILAYIASLLGAGWWSLLIVPLFLWWYVIEWLIRWAMYKDRDDAYMNISYEQEAYLHQAVRDYASVRQRFNWLRYLFKRTFRG